MASSRGGGGRLAEREQSKIQLNPLLDKDTRRSLRALFDILNSCFGVDGSLKQISNSNGGHVTVTSQSARLLQCISVTRPLNRLLCTVLQGHITNYMDCGLFAGRFALNLVHNALELDLHRHLTVAIISKLMELCVNILHSEQFHARIALSEIESERTSQRLLLLKSVVSTKPLCGLSRDDTTHISKLIYEAYALTLSADSNDKHLHYIHVEGSKPSDSRLLDGLLFETPHIPPYATKAVSDSIRIESGDEAKEIRVLLVASSMAGDFEDSQNIEYEVNNEGALMDAVVEQLLNTAEIVVQQQVGIVACQKVVHPEVEQYFESHDVLVLDRLGRVYLALVHNAVGGKVMHNLNSELTHHSYGHVQDVHHCVYNGKSYVQLCSKTSSVMTVLLANRSDESLAELKSVFESGLQALRLTDRSRWLLAGAGCWQTVLATSLHSKAMAQLSEWNNEIQAPSHMLRLIIDSFSRSLIRSGLPLNYSEYSVDTTYGHNWHRPADVIQHRFTSCCCGAIQHPENLEFVKIIDGSEIFSKASIVPMSYSDSCEVFDTYSSCVNAIQSGAVAAMMIVSTGSIIKDQN